MAKAQASTVSAIKEKMEQIFLLLKAPLPKVPLSQKVAMLEEIVIDQRQRIHFLEMEKIKQNAVNQELRVDMLLDSVRRTERGYNRATILALGSEPECETTESRVDTAYTDHCYRVRPCRAWQSRGLVPRRNQKVQDLRRQPKKASTVREAS